MPLHGDVVNPVDCTTIRMPSPSVVRTGHFASDAMNNAARGMPIGEPTTARRHLTNTPNERQSTPALAEATESGRSGYSCGKAPVSELAGRNRYTGRPEYWRMSA